jgi:hypothetical protein
LPARRKRPLRLAALVLALPGLAAAQAFDGSQSIDAASAVATGSGRVVGLGGAYAGVAEGMGGANVNPASVAHRRRDLRRGWDVDGTLSGFVLDARQDLDNDGRTRAGLAGRRHLELGGGLQLGRWGFGVLLRSWLASGARTAEGSAGIETSGVAFPVGCSALHDALVLGASVTAANGAVIQYRPDGGEARRLEYGSTTLRMGALARPRGWPVRLGGFFEPAARARAKGDATAFPATTPRSFTFPWTAGLGASAWVGPNAARYNEPSLRELERSPELGDGPAYEPGAPAPVLLTAQLDVTGPAEHAVTVASALADPAQARASGRHPSLTPRAGVEWEAVRWLRARGGWYLEASRSGATPRPHGTFGGEVRIPAWPWDLRLGLAGDLAARYRNVGLSLGLWGQLGPVPPPER